MAGALRKNKAGYNYKYVTEDEIQAKITAGMQKYNVLLLPGLRPDTLKVFPISYEKFDKKEKKNVNVNEVIVSCEVEYTWINTDNPQEQVKCGWAYVGQMEDASQAFGAGATYGNRYYLLKALQLATVDDDPDNYRSKQKQAEDDELKRAEKEESEKVKAVVHQIVELGKVLIADGKLSKEDLMSVVANYNDGNGNPNSISNMEIAQQIFQELTEKVGK